MRSALAIGLGLRLGYGTGLRLVLGLGGKLAKCAARLTKLVARLTRGLTKCPLRKSVVHNCTGYSGIAAIYPADNLARKSE